MVVSGYHLHPGEELVGELEDGDNRPIRTAMSEAFVGEKFATFRCKRVELEL